ncbi:MAG: glutaredoxin family protein [Bdellovibrio sp.]|nr:glutaredoxin family protein [Methylotenera sp.]
MPENHFILYSTANCHLCEDALALIQQCGANLKLSIIDIMDDAKLFSRYECTIPVLKSYLTETELNWPFDVEALGLFLSHNQ